MWLNWKAEKPPWKALCSIVRRIANPSRQVLAFGPMYSMTNLNLFFFSKVSPMYAHNGCKTTQQLPMRAFVSLYNHQHLRIPKQVERVRDTFK